MPEIMRSPLHCAASNQVRRGGRDASSPGIISWIHRCVNEELQPEAYGERLGA